MERTGISVMMRKIHENVWIWDNIEAWRLGSSGCLMMAPFLRGQITEGFACVRKQACSPQLQGDRTGRGDNTQTTTDALYSYTLLSVPTVSVYVLGKASYSY
jgi:hypothetical protein